METIVSELLSSHPELNPPRVYLIEGAPELRTGVEDLVYWWHLSVAKFSHLKNEARIDLLKVGEEKEGFERRKFRELGMAIAGLDHLDHPRAGKWEFSLSRAGLGDNPWCMSGLSPAATRSMARDSSWWWDGMRKGR
jgi:hypothetical protein